MRRRTFFGLTLAVALPTVTSDPLREINISTLVGDDPATDIAERIMREAYRRLGIMLVVHKLPGERTLLYFSFDESRTPQHVLNFTTEG